MGHNVFTPPRELQEGKDDTDHRHSTYTSSETSDSSYQRSVSIEVVGDDVGSLLQRLRAQEELIKQQQALLEE